MLGRRKQSTLVGRRKLDLSGPQSKNSDSETGAEHGDLSRADIPVLDDVAGGQVKGVGEHGCSNAQQG